MPDWNDILKEISTTPNQYDLVRRKYVSNLRDLTGRNIIIYYSGWLNHEDQATMITDEDLEGCMNAIHNLDRTKRVRPSFAYPRGTLSPNNKSGSLPS